MISKEATCGILRPCSQLCMCLNRYTCAHTQAKSSGMHRKEERRQSCGGKPTTVAHYGVHRVGRSITKVMSATLALCAVTARRVMELQPKKYLCRGRKNSVPFYGDLTPGKAGFTDMRRSCFRFRYLEQVNVIAWRPHAPFPVPASPCYVLLTSNQRAYAVGEP